MRSWTVVTSWVFAFLAMVIFSCERKGTRTVEVKESSKIIKSIMESLHDPIEQEGIISYHPEITVDSFILQTNYNQKGELIERSKFNSRGSLVGKEILTYDQNNNNTEKRVYEFNKITNRTTTIFNALNQIIENKEYDADGKPIKKMIVQHNSDGSQLASFYRLATGVFVKTSEKKFDVNQNNVETKNFSHEKVMSVEVNQYDHQKNRIENIQYNPIRREKRITHFKYDKFNNNIEKIVLNNNSIITSKSVFTYDAKNNLVKCYLYGIGGERKEYTQHHYEYDEAGNWTKKITMINRKPISVALHRIVYY